MIRQKFKISMASASSSWGYLLQSTCQDGQHAKNSWFSLCFPLISKSNRTSVIQWGTCKIKPRHGAASVVAEFSFCSDFMKTYTIRHLIGFSYEKSAGRGYIDNVFFWINPVEKCTRLDLFCSATSTEEKWCHDVFSSLRSQRHLLSSRFPILLDSIIHWPKSSGIAKPVG
jgi:hypothetical protein